jgi:hypothetical protein
MPLFNLATRLKSLRSILTKIDRRCDGRVWRRCCVSALSLAVPRRAEGERDRSKAPAGLERRYPI